MTARLGQVVGVEVVAELAERFGVYDRAPRVLSMFLGAGETTVLRQVAAYSQIVNGGRKITPTLIDRVQDRNGVTIFRADDRACATCKDIDWRGQEPPEIPDTRATIEDPRSAYQMVSILQGVVERGTGTAVKAVGKPLAGKTGTSNDYQDNWFVGFAPDLAAGVYIGFDNPRTLGDREAGGTNAAPIFRDFMAVALKDKPALAFRIPSGIRLVRVDPKTGQPARAGDRNVIYEAFKPGTEYAGGPVVSGNGTTDDEPIAPTSGVPGAPTPAVPASGTGGLY
jgi:penicillin-binding protein 1A